MENVFKELYSYNLKGVSLSIADAKVDTFQLLTKSYYNFFSRKCKEKSQSTDLQALFFLGNFKIYTKIDKYMLQNMKNGWFWRFSRKRKKRTRLFASLWYDRLNTCTRNEIFK